MSDTLPITLSDLEAAERLVRAAMPPTPEREWPLLSQRVGAGVVVKHENHAPTSAFKVRGGLVYCERLRRERPQVKGIISATRGNHGQSLAFAGARFGVPVTIVVPQGNSPEKNAAIRAFGATLIEHGADFQEAAEEARRLADACGLERVPAFHRDLVLGVATYGLELFRAEPALDRLYVPVGMGSGLCGCIIARDLLGLKTQIIGVQAEGAPSYALSFQAGRVVPTNSADTLADGLATRAPDAQALSVMLKGAARFMTVSDVAIAEAARFYWSATHNLAEGAGAAPLAAAIADSPRADERIGVVLSGSNIDLSLFQNWILATPQAPATR